MRHFAGLAAAGNDRACGVNPSFARSKIRRLLGSGAVAPAEILEKSSLCKESPGFIATAILEAKN